MPTPTPTPHQALFLLMQLCDGPNVYEVLEGHGQNPHPHPNPNPHPTPHHPHPSPHPTPKQVLEGHGPFEEGAALQYAACLLTLTPTLTPTLPLAPPLP
eukprot:scaffold86664_cov48-Phaeocystis_antarctica.AAC.1